MDEAADKRQASARLFVALDHPDLDHALELVSRLDGLVTRYKVGLELFTACGPSAVAGLRERGAAVFLDLKLCDIPETVRRASRAAQATGAEWLTVHASGGRAMLAAAVEGAGSTRILAVTVLTSLDLADLAAVGTRPASLEELVLERARLAQSAGCAGVIASPREAGALRRGLGPDFLIVTPGVRASAGGQVDDQKRTATAKQAIAAGASAVVVGRPIRDAADPRQAVLELLRDLT